MQQLSWRIVLSYLGGAILLVLALRLGGVIGDFWAGIGVLAVIFLFASTVFLPSYRTLADVLLFVWIGMTFLGPFIWSQLPPPVRDAWVMRKGSAIIRGSEFLTSYGAEAERIRHLYCAQEEDRLIKQEILPVKQQLDAMARAGVGTGLNDPKRLTLELSLRTREAGIKAWRERCAEGSQPSLPETNIGWWWLTAPLLLFGYGLYRASLQGPWTRWVGGAMIISAILLAGYWFFFTGGIEQAEGKVKGLFGDKPAPAALTRGARFTFPELCPDPNFYRKLEQGKVVDWQLGNRPGCDVQTFNIQSGEAEVVLAYASGKTEQIVWRGTDPGFQFKERVVGVSVKANTPVIYRAY